MNRLLVSAASFSAIEDAGVPEEIVYIPDGDHTITPTVNGKPKEVTVRVSSAKGEAIAATLNADLAERLGQNVRPIIDFDHAHRGPAAGIPKSFRYEQGKGIVLALDWTNAGRSAIEGKDFSYFSPEFLIDENGIPAGLPNRGPLGSLVNNPAFREIPRIAASDAAQHHQPDHTQVMSKLILAALNIDESRADAESVAVQRIQAMQSESKATAEKVEAAEKKTSDIEAENAELKKQLEAAEAKVKEAAEKRAEDLVNAAAADGRIAPKDDKTKAFYTRLIAAGDTEAEEALSTLPKRHEGITTPIIQAKQGDPAKDDDQSPYDKVKAAMAEELGEGS